jgi:hypothetical protein
VAVVVVVQLVVVALAEQVAVDKVQVALLVLQLLAQ